MENEPNIQEALNRIERLKAEISKWEQYVSLHRELFREKNAHTVTIAVKTIPTESEKRWTSAEIVDVAMNVLAANKRPMKLGALYEAVVARGVKIGGKNPRNNLGAMLSGDKLRLATGTGGWWFKDEAPPRQLCELDEYEEGPDADTPRPLHSNGAAALTA